MWIMILDSALESEGISGSIWLVISAVLDSQLVYFQNLVSVCWTVQMSDCSTQAHCEGCDDKVIFESRKRSELNVYSANCFYEYSG